MTVIAPVTELSLCVTPCCTRSPMTTSRIMSNGSIELSSRRPTARVTTKIRKKTTTVRKTRSMGSGERRDGAGDARDRLLGVVELDGVGPATDVRRVDLELEPHAQEVARLHRVVAEDDAPLARGLSDRGGLDRVDRHALEPAVVEHDPRVVDRRRGADVEPRLEEQAAADARRRGQPHRRGRDAGDRVGGVLAVA